MIEFQFLRQKINSRIPYVLYPVVKEFNLPAGLTLNKAKIMAFHGNKIKNKSV